MGTITYERPREKLQQKGASALTNAELLQVIIGNGTAGMPVSKIARKVDKALKRGGITLRIGDLTAIQGLGTVKAGQIVAGFELATRLLYQENVYKDLDSLADLYTDVRTSKKRTLLYAFFDGGGRLIDDYSRPIEQHDNTSRIVQKLFAEALAQSTASVLIAVGFESQVLEPTMFELGLAREVYVTAKLLSIPVKSFVLVGESGEYVIKEANHGQKNT